MTEHSLMLQFEVVTLTVLCAAAILSILIRIFRGK